MRVLIYSEDRVDEFFTLVPCSPTAIIPNNFVTHSDSLPMTICFKWSSMSTLSIIWALKSSKEKEKQTSWCKFLQLDFAVPNFQNIPTCRLILHD